MEQSVAQEAVELGEEPRRAHRAGGLRLRHCCTLEKPVDTACRELRGAAKAAFE